MPATTPNNEEGNPVRPVGSEPWSRDIIVSRSQYRVRWWTCIKLLLGWELSVQVDIQTEVPQMRVHGIWRVNDVAPSWWPKPKPVGVEHFPSDEIGAPEASQADAPSIGGDDE